MANLYRLIFAVCLLALSAVSHAVITPSYTYKYADGFIGTPSEIVAHQQALEGPRGCNYGASTMTYVISFNNATASSVDIRYSFSCPTGTSASNLLIYTAPRESSVCPVGSAVSGGSCQCVSPLVEIDGQCLSPACPDGQHEEGGACVPNSCIPNETRVNGVCVSEPACPAGETRVNGVCQKSNCKTGAIGGYYDMTSAASVATCSHNGAGQYCSMIIEHDSTAYFPEGARYYGIGRLTGTSCAPAPDGPGSSTPTDPPKPSDPNTPKPTQPATPGAPAGDSPGQTRPGSSPGTDGNCPPDSYKSNGSCYPKNPSPEAPDSDGKCPVGTIKVGSVCAVLQPAPDKEPGEEEKKPSVFGGACNAVACEGDAIQCAIARDQYKRSCELMEKESPESQLYPGNKGKEGDQTGSLPGNQTINMAGRIDTSDALGAVSAGVSDLNVTVWGQSLTLPFSMLNPYLAALGNVLLSVSFLIALRIVARG
jgi:hypothetical protein